jgi:amidase
LSPEELAYAGVARQAELVRAGEVSSRELVELCLERIERLEPALNAFRIVMAERALAEAEQAQARLGAGEDRPLLGVPLAIKDNVDVAGELTTHGTGAYGPPAAADAEVVARLRSAGAIVIGKTQLPELAAFGFTESATWGVTNNPWNADRTCGGSSGGSAAAVAAGMVGIAQASDGAGSIRIPAACCGLFGLKPQRGRISMAPDPDHWHGLSVFGCVSRSVLDTALFLDVASGAAAGDPVTPPPPSRPFVDAVREAPPRLRIAVSTQPVVPARIDDEVRRAVEQTAALLRSLGHDVRERDPDWGSIRNGIGNPSVARYLRGIRDDAARMPKPWRLERRTRGLARLGRLVGEGLLARTRSAEPAHAARLNAIFDDHDVVLTPVAARPPVEVGRWEGLGGVRTLAGMFPVYPFTVPWNFVGQPAAAVPAGFTADGLPLSVQLAGRPNDEATLLSLAAQLEAERSWADKLPPLA